MADYIYLLENRLSPAQQTALAIVRDVARAKGLTVFLVGGAVRDLTSGSPVRDLDVVVQGNALKLKKDIEKAGGEYSGEWEAGQSLYVRFAGGVRMEIGSAVSVSYPKPGKPVVKPAAILDDLRRRDFTANAMALSLNDGSFGLLMDPTNGVADIENRELRLTSNYGFIEDPVRMIRVARLMARLGWQMEERTRSRYETGKEEGYISAMGEFQRGYELEELFHEEDPLHVLTHLESEGWLKHLSPALGSSKANTTELAKLREAQMQLVLRGIHADGSEASFPLLTAKVAPKDVVAIKKSFPRQGFVRQIESLEAEGKEFAATLSAKTAATPSASWKLLMAAKPEVVLWVAYSTRSATLQAKFKSFYTEWPQAQQKIPYILMQEMRITPELPEYKELVEKLFFELMDGKLGTPEEMKAFLEPYSPPAPPPPVHVRRARSAKKDAKPAKSRKKPVEEPIEDEESLDGVPSGLLRGEHEDGDHEDDLDEDETAVVDAAVEVLGDEEPVEEDVIEVVPPKKVVGKPVKAAPAKTASVPAQPASVKPVALEKPVAAKKAPAKAISVKVAVKVEPKPVAKSKAPAKAAKPAVKAPVAVKAAARKQPVKAVVTKIAAKAAAPAKKAAAKSVSAKKAVVAKSAAKPVPKKLAGKVVAKPAAKKAVLAKATPVKAKGKPTPAKKAAKPVPAKSAVKPAAKKKR